MSGMHEDEGDEGRAVVRYACQMGRDGGDLVDEDKIFSISHQEGSVNKMGPAGTFCSSILETT